MLRFDRPIEPMTLGTMRELGVRSLDVSCWLCHHRPVLSADRWPDDAAVPTFGPRMVCTGRPSRDYRVSPKSASPPAARADQACANAVTRASEVEAPLPSPFSKSPSTQPSWFETWARQITGRRQAAANA
jgi:hypothetical protein